MTSARSLLGVAVLGAAVLGLPAASSATDMLAVPFHLPAARAADGPVPVCDDRKMAAPVVSLKVTSIYDQTVGDETHSTIDPQSKRAYDAAMAPLRTFVGDMARYANRYVRSGGDKVAEADCVLKGLASWARGDALSDLSTRQAGLSSTRIIAGLAFAYMQVKRSPAGSAEDRADIDRWFAARAQQTKRLFAGNHPGRTSNQQNHRYWGGLAVAAAGVAIGDRALLAWGVESYRIGACQIDDDGFLPLELARGKRARDYHIHALTPLVMIAELATANGTNLYQACDGGLRRLVATVVRSITDPAEMERRADAKQVALPTEKGRPSDSRIIFLVPYLDRFPDDPVAGAVAIGGGSVSSTLVGGDLTLLYGSKGRS